MKKNYDFFAGLFYLIIIFFLLLVSCKKDAVADNSFKVSQQLDSIDNIFLLNLDATGDVVFSFPGNGQPFRTQFNYGSGKITARRGAYIYFPPASGYPFLYDMLVFDTVIYTNNTIRILTQKTDPNLGLIPVNERDLVFANGLLQRKTTATDTTDYYYSNNKLAKSILLSKGVEKTFQFTYDNNNNLAEMYQSWHFISDPAEGGFLRMRFSGFDHAPNPFSDYGLWDDLLYRSLSINNFTKVEYTKDSTEFGSTTLQLHYDTRGNLDVVY